jgi:hypothetical protein
MQNTTPNYGQTLCGYQGGALNLNKCYYFAFAPVINYKKRKTQCTDLPMPHPLVITNCADNSRHHIERVSPSVSRRTLGVLLSPDRDERDQLRLCLSRAKEFLGKFKNSSMPNKAKWIAVTTIIKPAIIYPLLNTTFSPKDISPIDSCLSQMKCSYALTISWVSDPITSFDKSLMTIAVSKYNKKGSYIINKCRIYLQVISDIDLLIFETADIHIEPWGLIVVGKLYTSNVLEMPRDPPNTLQEAFHLLPTSLKNICGEVHLPSDNGKELINHITANKYKLFGASDASFRDRKASHEWIISTDSIDDIGDDDLCIHSHGPVDGLAQYISSGRGELTGITALSIMTQLFLNYHSSNATLEAICDNKRVINKCGSLSFARLRTH